MFDRPQAGERAVLVHISPQGQPDADDLHEFQQLALSAGAEVAALVTGIRGKPDSRLFVGSGKAEEIRQQVEENQAELVIFDHSLSPSQERNLEKLLQARVLDRTGLILDIFAQRARSFEGKLQVELAQLRHLSTRLVRGWTHLERQKGGIGLRGPGETQLETDRRLLSARIDQIRNRLERVDCQREQGRRARRRAEIPTVALVGYTNAGKSTLFNALTQADVYTQDQLFATLDPTLRRVELEDGCPLILADTVGFISKLPHELVAAFKSTLQETVEADLLLHVVDAASHQRDQNMAEVDAVLKEIGADQLPRIEVFNKLDELQDQQPRLERDQEDQVTRVWCSALTGSGMEMLQMALAERFRTARVQRTATLSVIDGRLRALLYEHAKVVAETQKENGDSELEIEILSVDLARLLKAEPELAEKLEA